MCLPSRTRCNGVVSPKELSHRVGPTCFLLCSHSTPPAPHLQEMQLAGLNSSPCVGHAHRKKKTIFLLMVPSMGRSQRHRRGVSAQARQRGSSTAAATAAKSAWEKTRSHGLE